MLLCSICIIIKNDIKTQSHAGVRQMFGLHFVKTEMISIDLGKFYSDIFDMRHSGDYIDFVEFSELEVLEAIQPAKNLISRIEILLK